ncbi:hypothetical protein RRG08_045114 [Elysia crispata]|uniref:Uncharacterized protein n=1 Tax=Elysia crispata TaxID=231223 RepID=A0AAE1D457_9GAST|nr:hypothetical protein RRG08_045114 [Elysia crispata]
MPNRESFPGGVDHFTTPSEPCPQLFPRQIDCFSTSCISQIPANTGVPIKDVYEMNSLGLGHSFISIKGGFTSVYPALPCLARTSLIYLKDFDVKPHEVFHAFIEQS